jgi:HD-like signal output (HDOD) protein
MALPLNLSAQDKENYLHVLGKMESLNGNMAVLSRLGIMLHDPNNGIDTIAKLLQSDGALSSNAIRSSNSVRYGIGPKISNVEAALVKVGYNQIISVIGTALSKQVFMKDLPAYNMTADEYWAYSYFCGVFLEAQAHRVGIFSDEAYLIGLLHGVGRIVLNELLIKGRSDLVWDKTIPCHEWEEQTIGFRNDQAGATLLKNWKFSPGIYQRVADQNLSHAQAKDLLLLLLDYARCCAELNQYHIDAEVWLLPTDHPYTQNPEFDARAMAEEIEAAKRTCLDIRVAIKAH